MPEDSAALMATTASGLACFTLARLTRKSVCLNGNCSTTTFSHGLPIVFSSASITAWAPLP